MSLYSHFSGGGGCYKVVFPGGGGKMARGKWHNTTLVQVIQYIIKIFYSARFMSRFSSLKIEHG